MENNRFFSSWSGGKDSALAFLKAKNEGYCPSRLFTALDGDGKMTRAHGFGQEIIAAQADSIGVDSFRVAAGWGQYEEKLIAFINESKGMDIKYGVFGDIDLVSHREWIERVCNKTDITPIFPLWGMKRIDVVREFIEVGFKAKVVACKKEYINKNILGREIDNKFVDDMLAEGIDPAGENGEFHTIVYDGPIFRAPIKLVRKELYKNEKNIIMSYLVDNEEA